MSRDVTPEQLASARAAWARVGARLAARGRMRKSRTGRAYRLRDECDVTVELPMQPTAVMLYDLRTGCAPVFVVDLDASKAALVDGATVEDDLAAIEALCEAAGLHARFSDSSVSGGRHLYVPLAVPAPFPDAREAAVALEVLFASVDAMPMRGLEGGCIRPPGAWHRRGGHQVLSGPVEAAEAALDAPNDELAWRRFLDELRTRVPYAAELAARHSDYAADNGRPYALNPLHQNAQSPGNHQSASTAHTASSAPLSSLPRPQAADAAGDGSTRCRRDASPASTRDTSGEVLRDSSTPARRDVSRSAAADPSLEQLDPLPGWHEPDAKYQHIARTGDYDPNRYASASEARQGVMWACAASGWAFRDVVRRIEDGTWPGLASYYAKYRGNGRHKALSADWREAVEHERRRRASREKRAPEAAGVSRVRRCTTSPHKTSAGGQGSPSPERSAPTSRMSRGEVQRFVREWLTAVDLIHGPETDSTGLAMRALLYALANMAILTDRIEVQVGNRGLAIGSGTDPGTVSRVLRRLLAEPSDRALVDVIQEARGVQAHVVQLRIPTLLAPHCAATPWRAGRIHGIRAAFRELGRAAAFVYDALERTDGPIGGQALAAEARISASATYDALAVLSAWGLATNTGAGWIVGEASLARLAEQFGVDEAVRAQIERYRADRRAWWAWLVAHGLLDPAWVDRRSTPPPQPDPPPPRTSWSDDTSAVELLMRELGAEVIERAG